MNDKSILKSLIPPVASFGNQGSNKNGHFLAEAPLVENGGLKLERVETGSASKPIKPGELAAFDTENKFDLRLPHNGVNQKYVSLEKNEAAFDSQPPIPGFIDWELYTPLPTINFNMAGTSRDIALAESVDGRGVRRVLDGVEERNLLAEEFKSRQSLNNGALDSSVQENMVWSRTAGAASSNDGTAVKQFLAQKPGSDQHLEYMETVWSDYMPESDNLHSAIANTSTINKSTTKTIGSMIEDEVSAFVNSMDAQWHSGKPIKAKSKL